MHEELLIQCAVLHNWHTTSCIKRGKNVLIMDTLWKHNLNFVKDVPRVHVNFVITVFIVSLKKKKGGILFYQPLYHFKQVDAYRTSVCFICAAYCKQIDAGRKSLYFC